MPPPPPSADGVASDIMSQVDTDGSGGISKSELETFAQSNGGTTGQADSILSSLDSDSDGLVSKTEVSDAFKRFMETMQTSMVSQMTSSSVSITA
jgi:Ca2+-binding EF-hand superfamily protein